MAAADAGGGRGKVVCASVDTSQVQVGIAALSGLKAPKPGKSSSFSGRFRGQALAGAITHDAVSGLAIGFTLWIQGSSCALWASLDENLEGAGTFFCGSSTLTAITFTPVACP